MKAANRECDLTKIEILVKRGNDRRVEPSNPFETKPPILDMKPQDMMCSLLSLELAWFSVSSCASTLPLTWPCIFCAIAHISGYFPLAGARDSLETPTRFLPFNFRS